MSKIKKGYKKTKVGVIPEDWEVVRLGDIATFYKGKGISKKDISEDGIPCIRYGELYTKYDEKIQDVFSKTNLNKEDLFLSHANDILIPASGETAIDLATASCILQNDIGIGGDINIIRSSMNGIFLSYYLNVIAKIHIASLAQGVSVIHLYSSQLKNLYIVKPPLKEQEKIAKILTTWDRAIEKLEALITQKEQLKKGLMQKLLSGEVRFGAATLVAGDNATKVATPEWEEIKLGDIFAERTKRYKNLSIKEVKIYSELLSVGINTGVTKRSENDAKDNSSADKSNHKIVNKNDIVYNTMRMWQGASGVSFIYGIVSPAYTVVYLKQDYSIEFFGLLFKKHRVVFDFYRYSQGLTSDTWNLKYPHFSEVKVKIPIIKEEQQKIAQVLTTADKEIELLKEELKALKEQKRGLMQKLLTGEVRVRV